MKKHIVLALALLAGSAAANAECHIGVNGSDYTENVFNKYGGWSLSHTQYGTLCEKLRRANARIQILADSQVLEDRSIGWAVLTVMDANFKIQTMGYSQMSTQMYTSASQDKADEMMVLAINEAAKSWKTIDQALSNLNAERNKIRATYGK